MGKLAPLKEALAKPSKARELDLSEVKLRDVPAGVAKLTGLRVLKLGGNQLRELPAFLASLTKLEELDIVANTITKVDKALSSLPLKKLRVSAVPKAYDVLFSIPTLRELEIQSIPQLAIPASLAKHPSLEEIHLFVCGMKEFPTVLGALPKLDTLSLASSQIEKWPAKISGFKALRTLNLGSMGIKKVPRAFCDLPLTSLYLGDNEEIVLDDNLLRLTKLETLHFNNVYKPLSPIIGKMTSLRELYVSNNSIEGRVAPSWLANLRNLELLDVSNNDDLEEIPPTILALPKLRKLVVFNCAVAEGIHLRRLRELAPPHLEIALDLD